MSDWTVVVPVKPWRLAKSRLAVDPALRERLVEAFAGDVMSAIASTPAVGAVVVVTAEREVVRLARSHGAVVVEDRPMVDPDPLNAAVHRAAQWARIRRSAAPIVCVPADLPALTAAGLSVALAELAERGGGFVPDASGSGTTLVAAMGPSRLRAAYGSGSAHAHSALGLSLVADVPAGVRQDVDTVADLAAARLLGVGAHTAAALAGADRRPTAPSTSDRESLDRQRRQVLA